MSPWLLRRQIPVQNIDQLFRLVEWESQRDTLSCYYYRKTNAPPQCEKYEVRSGNSYNLLASTSICWLETIQVSKSAKSYQPRERATQDDISANYLAVA